MEIVRGKIESAQKVVLYGPEGIGKSTFASNFPGALFIDTEGSTKHLDVARTPTPSSWTMLTQQVEYVRNNPDICQTLIIDTADWAERLCIADMLARYKKGGIEDFGYGKGYTYLAEEFGRLLNLLGDLVERGINVVLTAHAMMRKFEQPDEMGAYDRWELKLQRKTAPILKEWADMLLFANYKTILVTDESTNSKKAHGGKRIMYTTHHPAWDAKNRHNLPEELPFDFASIAHCIPAGKAATAPQQEKEPIGDVIERLKSEETLQSPPEREQEPEPEAVQEINLDKAEATPEVDDLLNGPSKSILDISKPLYDLMYANFVTDSDIQQAVAKKGYYPRNTPIANYDPGFIEGVLVGAWAQVYQLVKQIQDDEIPFK